MADHQNCSFVFFKRTFKFFFCIYIQMIGRLIKYKQVRLTVNNFA